MAAQLHHSARLQAFVEFGFPHDALFPSHTQETSLGKNLNVNMTVRERLSICDGPVTD